MANMQEIFFRKAAFTPNNAWLVAAQADPLYSNPATAAATLLSIE
jgi:hypothetical protein